MTNKLTLTEQEELFAKDCKLINLKYEYNGYTGDEKWAIITELSVKELWEKYPLVIERYSPFVHLSIAQGEVIDDANRNEDKYAKRSSRTLGTGLRVGEVTGLRWCDIDLEDGIIDVNHTLVYYDHRTSEGKKGCYFNVNTPKTEAGNRQVPMLDFVKEAFVMEKERQELLGVHCEATIDGYTDFIFLNRFGQPQHQSTLNKAIRRIIRDCNDEQFLKTENPKVLLPHFSCHSLRHTFTTRMCEAGVNIKVIQDTLGHKDITTTLNIYTDVTKELKRTEFDGLDKYFNNSIA